MSEDRTGEISTQTTLMEGNEEMGDDTKAILEQTYVNTHKRLEQTAERFNDGSSFVAQESKQGFLLAKGLMQATAQNLLEKEGLADTLLQLKTSGQFPNNLPTSGGVVGTN